MEKSSWQVETSETQRSLGPSRGSGYAQALIAKESVEISKSISPINPQLQIDAPAIRGLLQQFVVFKLTYAVARFFFDKL